MKKLEDALNSEGAMHAPLHEIERMLETQGREMLRAMMQAHFDLRAAGVIAQFGEQFADPRVGADTQLVAAGAGLDRADALEEAIVEAQVSRFGIFLS